MELDELFELFFDNHKSGAAYESEREYIEDKLRFLDVVLIIACSLKYRGEEDDILVEMENMHLRGVPITGSEVLQALRENTLDRQEETVLDEIREVILQAYVHIVGRLKVSQIDSRILQIKEWCELTDFEEFLVWLAYANYKDAKYELLYAYLQGDVRLKFPTLRMAATVFGLYQTADQETLGRLAMGRGILFDLLLDKKEVYDNVKLVQSYTLYDNVYGWLMGYNELSPKLETVAVLLKETSEEAFLRIEENACIQQMMEELEQDKDGACKVLNLFGEKGNGRRFMIQQGLKKTGKQGILVNVLQLEEEEDLAETIQMIYREATLLNCLVCFYYPENEKETEERKDGIITKIRKLIYLCKRYFSFFIWISEEKAEFLLDLELRYVGIKVNPLSLTERYLFCNEIAKQYPVSENVDFRLMSNQYRFSMQGVKDVFWNANIQRKSEGRDEINEKDFQFAVKQQSVSQLGQLAHLIPASYTWDDLILEEEARRQLEMICNQVKYKSIVGEEWGFYEKTAYGRGVCALFAGAPGTGKTMAVQVIANELGLNLYRIDLSQLMSKYVGETEKNISKVFEKAREINALLFFDEADSLFARRLDVKDSMDRSANAQTGHLLQQIEDYDGITIMATNLAMNIDDAFKRRIKFIVKFAFPTVDVRLQLWKSILPKKVPCEEELDLEFFAENFELSGSSIKEILTTAAFLAAAEKRKLSNLDMIEAVKMNFSKYGKTLANEEFGYLL